MLKGTTISSYLPMSSGNSNPILRRLGVEGVGTSGHFIGGRFGKTAEEVEDEALRLLARVFMDETSEGEIDLTSAFSKSGHITAKGFKCRECGDDSSGKATRVILGEAPAKERRVCMDCWDKDFRSKCLLKMEDEEEIICRVCEEEFLPSKLQATHGIIARLNYLTEADTPGTRNLVKIGALKADAVKDLRAECAHMVGFSKDGFDIPNLGTTNWTSLSGKIEISHHFVDMLYDCKTVKLDVGAMVNTVVILASLVTRKYISDYVKLLQSWNVNVSGHVGWRLVVEGVKLGCSVEENQNVLALFEAYDSMTQGTDTLLDYMTKFDQIQSKLDKESGESTSQFHSVHKFISGMNVKSAFQSRFSLQYPDQKYE